MNIETFLKEIKSSPVEKIGVILHDSTGAIGAKIVGTGTANRCKVMFSDVANAITEFNASMITLVHNHPTGAVRPSTEDLEMTYKVQDILKEFGVTVNDHLILGGNGGVFSFADNGVI